MIEVEALRSRRMKNFLTALMMSAGTPMLLMGDEMRRSRGGNNAFCGDGDGSCLDWRLLERHAGHRFFSCLTALRLRRIVDESQRLSLNQLLQWAQIEWHGVALGRPDWSDGSHSLAFTARTPCWHFAIHGMFNAYWSRSPSSCRAGPREPYPVAALRGHGAAVARRHLHTRRGAAGYRHLSRAPAVVRRARLGTGTGPLAGRRGRRWPCIPQRAPSHRRSARQRRGAGGPLLPGAPTANPAERVSFGTSGHRGSSLARTFNEAHVLAIRRRSANTGRSTASTVRCTPGRTHTLSGAAFMTALEVLAAHGVHTMVDHREGYTPTPAISHAILTHNRGRTSRLADGIVITPSHNPPEDGGLKYNPPTGGPADTTVTRWIQDRANDLLAQGVETMPRVPRARQAGPDDACATMSGRTSPISSR